MLRFKLVAKLLKGIVLRRFVFEGKLLNHLLFTLNLLLNIGKAFGDFWRQFLNVAPRRFPGLKRRIGLSNVEKKTVYLVSRVRNRFKTKGYQLDCSPIQPIRQ